MVQTVLITGCSSGIVVLPVMREHHSGHVINMSSIGGRIACGIRSRAG